MRNDKSRYDTAIDVIEIFQHGDIHEHHLQYQLQLSHIYSLILPYTDAV